MSLYDRESPSPSNDRPAFKPLEPVDWFVEEPSEPLDARLHDGRVMFRPGVGLLRSVSGVWAGMGRKLWVPASQGKVGATAGWASNTDDGLIRLPASQTGSTWIIPLTGLNIGDRITAIRAIGQVESDGNAVTVLLDVAKTTAAVADFVQAALGTQQTTGALVADTLISEGVLEVTGLAEVVDSLEHFFAVITGTTGLTTDVAFSGVEVELG